jgi:hypothetical protein
MRRSVLISALAGVAALLGAALPAAGDSGPGTLVQRHVAARLAELEAMTGWGWWAQAEAAHRELADTIKQNQVDNALILDRMAKARAALDAELKRQAANPETRRLDDLLARVRKLNPRFPADRHQTLRVNPDGSGDYRTLVEALTHSKASDVIELYTGRFIVSRADLNGPGGGARRARVLVAARGEWPRIVPEAEESFTFDEGMFVDGLEILPGKRGINDKTFRVANCYLRSPLPPPSVKAGPGGLLGGKDVRLSDSIVRYMHTGVAASANTVVQRTLFMTCVKALTKRGGKARVRPTQCAFYRCLTAVAAKDASARDCLFSRVKSLAPANEKLQQDDCLAHDDPFRNPFKGDFRLREGLTTPGGKAPGPQWADERWEMFMANWDLPPDAMPKSLAACRDEAAARALAKVRDAVKAEQWDASAAGLAKLLGPYRDCASVRRADAEILRLVNIVLTRAIAKGVAPGIGSLQAREQADAKLAEADKHLADGNANQAIVAVEEAIGLDPTHLSALHKLAKLLIESGQPAKAQPTLGRAEQLIEALAHRVSPAQRTEQLTLRARLDKLLQARRDWKKLADEYADKFAVAAGPDGLPSQALAYQRATLLRSGDEDFQRRLARAKRVLVPALKSSTTQPDAAGAEQLREQARDLVRQRRFSPAIERLTDAWARDPKIDDLLQLARCYQQLKTGRPQAALLGLMARLGALRMEDQSAGGKILRSAVALIKNADPSVIRLEQLDREFIELARRRSAQADALGDKQTAGEIAETLERLDQVDEAVLGPLLPVGRPAEPPDAGG